MIANDEHAGDPAVFHFVYVSLLVTLYLYYNNYL